MSPQNWPSDKVRSTFLDFFVKTHHHTYVESSKTIPHDDPTLLFANAGMNQFKPLFLGQVGENDTSFLAGLNRAANSQKCIRAGGKHNDLDDVGKDTYHHTFFEMLGNWSFGDYFKEEAIDMAWDLLVNVYGLDPQRLYVTYFEGIDGVPADAEAKRIWSKYLPDERVLPFSAKDNFWEMGDVGPCGPCSEIHFDRIGGRDAASLVNMDDPNVIEIWNLVFIQYNRELDQSLSRLPAKHVDTGMGFERLCSILQDVKSNYDTDIFVPIFDEIQKITGARKYTGNVGTDDVDGIDTAYRVIADHIRTLSIAIADGGVPSNKDRGYVLRRIVRRAVRFGKQYLNAEPGFFHLLVDIVIKQLGDVFPFPKPERIKKIINEEEIQFGKTLDAGERQFQKLVQSHPADQPKVISGKDAFDLYQTYGFPVDLTLIMAEEKGFTVDQKGFHDAREAAAQLSRDVKKETSETLELQADQTATLQTKMNVKPTDDSFKYTWEDLTDVKVQAIFTKKNGFVDSIDSSSYSENDIVGFVLDKTPFYAQKGGQIFDTGFLLNNEGGRFEVGDVRVYAGFVFHSGFLQEGEFSVGDTIKTQVDFDRRRPIAANHTATHVLNYSLRKHLGNETDQEGSMVDHEKLRFDFSFNGEVEPKQLTEIENTVRGLINNQVEVHHSEQPFEKATKIHGLRQMFKAKYPDELVRVISVGHPVDQMILDPDNTQWTNYSVEFCGGTHLYNTKDMEEFAIITETGISRGVRRMVAVTKDAARKAHQDADAFFERVKEAQLVKDREELATLFSTISSDFERLESIPLTKKALIKDEIKNLFNALKKMQQSAYKEEKKEALALSTELAKKHKDASHLILCLDPKKFSADQDKIMKDMIAKFKKAAPALPVLLMTIHSGKDIALFKVNVPKQVSDKVNAKAWLDATAEASEGKGGGNATFAQGQAKTSQRIQESLDASKKFVESIFGESIVEGSFGGSGAAPAETIETVKQDISKLEEENKKLKNFVGEVSKELNKTGSQ
eukprot:CAMPEP_0117447580 /NCGR_PEP_ID=MMETSP0759-20121206/6951_1 /TAXON_ID=63605 /ORGANISM="Percolomonas cosmopolitus, Strain WS" /LENGTH=1013 /DNA_ID=CAMNT_0005239925 /DNA_START=153 /DNA_END=3194 /DNA_ORIENTATION=+